MNPFELDVKYAEENFMDMKKMYPKAYNKNKWFKIFGISLAALTAVTLTATLTFNDLKETADAIDEVFADAKLSQKEKETDLSVSLFTCIS